ncbi:MAG: hypothetical protein WA946_04825 [Nitrospirota bacterium]
MSSEKPTKKFRNGRSGDMRGLGKAGEPRCSEAPASREQDRARACASSLMIDVITSQADTAEPFPPGEGK